MYLLDLMILKSILKIMDGLVILDFNMLSFNPQSLALNACLVPFGGYDTFL